MEALEGSARAGSPEVTGQALMEARGDHEVAQMALTGSQKRIQRLSDWLKKVHTDKAVAEIVKDALVARMLPGAASYATFANVKDTKPDTAAGSGGSAARRRDRWRRCGAGEGSDPVDRSPLHSPLDADRLRAALEASSFAID